MIFSRRFELNKNEITKKSNISCAVSFGVWAVLIGTGYYLREFLGRQPSRYISAYVFAIVAIHMLFWVWPMYLRGERDGRLAIYFGHLAERIVTNSQAPSVGERPKVEPSIREFLRFLRHWPAIAQVIISAVLGVGVVVTARWARNF